MARKAQVKRRKNNSKKSPFIKKSRFILPWPVTVLILLAVGVLLVGWTFQAGAANLQVSAKVSAPLPTDPAIITSPSDGDRFSEIPITVEGTCPLDSYVNIYTNNFYRGSVLCDSNGAFQLDVDLFPGANELRARVFNITDDEGPQSDPITVYYDLPVPPSPPPPSPTPPTPPSPSGGGSTTNPPANPPKNPVATAPFLIKTNFKYTGVSVGQKLQWKINVSGGTVPYALNIEWGDGENSVMSVKKAGALTIEHVYKSQGDGIKHTYNIKINGSDSVGRKAHLQLFVVVNPSKFGSIVANTIPPKPGSDNWLLLAWPAYTVVVLMFISFWLGEKEEIIKLKKAGYLRRRST